MTDRPSLGRQIAEVRAESEADYRIETMEAVLDTLLWCERHADVIRRVVTEVKAEVGT